MTNSPEDAVERNELELLLRQALEERERLRAEGKALREENARLKRLRYRAKRNSSGAS